MLFPGIAQVVNADTGVKNDLTVTRIYGKTRVGTSIEASKVAFEDGARNVVLAGYNGEVDALAGTVLAKVKNAPLLLVTEGELDSIKSELERLDAQNLYVLGGSAVVSEEIVTELKKDYKVERISGKNREETAVRIAEKADVQTKHVFLAKGYGEVADALAIGPVSAKKDMPILLTDTHKVNKVTLDAIKDLGVEKVTIVGGDAAVTDAVKDQLGKVEVDRVFGTNRLNTAIEIARRYFDNPENAVVASGYKFADALVGGYLGAIKNAPILLSNVNSIDALTIAYLEDGVNHAYILGGTAVISEAVENNVKEAVEVVQEVKITLDVKGAKVEEEIETEYTVVKGTKVKLLSYFDMTKDGYSLKGWLNTNTDEKVTGFKPEVEVNEDVTYEAIWEETTGKLQMYVYSFNPGDKMPSEINLVDKDGNKYELTSNQYGPNYRTWNTDIIVKNGEYTFEFVGLEENTNIRFEGSPEILKSTAVVSPEEGQEEDSYKVTLKFEDNKSSAFTRVKMYVESQNAIDEAAAVEEKIDKLPEDKNILDNGEMIVEAQKAYDSLSEEGKSLVSDDAKTTLEESVNKFKLFTKGQISGLNVAVANEDDLDKKQELVDESQVNLDLVEELGLGEAEVKHYQDMIDSAQKQVDKAVAEKAAAEKAAEEAVEKAEKSKLLVDKNAAQELVYELIDSDTKDNLQARLDAIKIELTLEEELADAEKALADAQRELEKQEWIQEVHGGNEHNVAVAENDVARAKKEVEELKNKLELKKAENAAENAVSELWGYIGKVTQENKEEVREKLGNIEQIVKKAKDLGSKKDLDYSYPEEILKEEIEILDLKAAENAAENLYSKLFAYYYEPITHENKEEVLGLINELEPLIDKAEKLGSEKDLGRWLIEEFKQEIKDLGEAPTDKELAEKDLISANKALEDAEEELNKQEWIQEVHGGNEHNVAIAENRVAQARKIRDAAQKALDEIIGKENLETAKTKIEELDTENLHLDTKEYDGNTYDTIKAYLENLEGMSELGVEFEVEWIEGTPRLFDITINKDGDTETVRKQFGTWE